MLVSCRFFRSGLCLLPGHHARVLGQLPACRINRVAKRGNLHQIKGILKQDPETALKSGHPGPEVELEFWRNKAENLNSLHVQLSGEKIRKVVKVLEVTKSTYFPAFNRLCKEVAQARMEVILR